MKYLLEKETHNKNEDTSEELHLDLDSHLDHELLFYLITYPVQPAALRPHYILKSILDLV